MERIHRPCLYAFILPVQPGTSLVHSAVIVSHNCMWPCRRLWQKAVVCCSTSRKKDVVLAYQENYKHIACRSKDMIRLKPMRFLVILLMLVHIVALQRSYEISVYGPCAS